VVEGAAALPPDAGLIVLAGPRRDLSEGEVAALVDRVHGGDSLLVLADHDAPASVARLLARFGVELAHDVIVDARGRLFGTDGLSARVTYLNEQFIPRPPDAQALLPLAQSLRLGLVEAPDVHGDYLAMTGDDTWADVDRRVLATPDAPFRPGVDRHGPLPVAVFVRVPAANDREGRMLAIGDTDFITNLSVNLVGNRDLFLALAELAARADPLAAARPAARPGGTFSPLALSSREGRVIFWNSVVLPAVVFVAIAAVLARRQHGGWA